MAKMQITIAKIKNLGKDVGIHLMSAEARAKTIEITKNVPQNKRIAFINRLLQQALQLTRHRRATKVAVDDVVLAFKIITENKTWHEHDEKEISTSKKTKQTSLEGRIVKPIMKIVESEKTSQIAIVRTDSDGPPELAKTFKEFVGLTMEVEGILLQGESVTFDLVKSGKPTAQFLRDINKYDTHVAYIEFIKPIRSKFDRSTISFKDAAIVDQSILQKEIEKNNTRFWFVEEHNIANFNPDYDIYEAMLTKKAQKKLDVFIEKYRPVFQKKQNKQKSTLDG